MSSWRIRFAWPAILVVAGAACSAARTGGDDGPAPGLTFPARYPEGESEPESASAAAASGSVAAPDGGAPRTGFLPDPKPLSLARQWEYELVHDRGSVRVASVTERRFTQPVVTARRMGRYAIELWIGRELVDRVRFDFPLLGAEPVREGRRRPLKEPPVFAPGAVVTRRVLVPASERATRAVLLDRATGRTLVLPWPPDVPLPAAAAPPLPDGGAAAVDAGPPDTASPDASLP